MRCVTIRSWRTLSSASPSAAGDRKMKRKKRKILLFLLGTDLEIWKIKWNVGSSRGEKTKTKSAYCLQNVPNADYLRWPFCHAI
jgi:hypothetical protein